ncbi:MAG TPA: chemotaxis protein CheX [Moraxellaceae bacterium]|nr:chemotaxis protein CheX [Moraxellaceae bacterium]
MSTILQYELINDVTEQVWSQFLGIPLAASATVHGEAECAASISIEGAWNGAIIVACSRQLARQAAATMFSLPLSEIDDASWRDTLNEVANIMGGNIKALLPGPSQLGLPEAFDTWQPYGDPNTIVYMSEDGPLYVTLFPVEA